MIERDILTVRSPRQGEGVEIRSRHYREEPPGEKRYSHREVSLSRGRDGDEKLILGRGASW